MLRRSAGQTSAPEKGAAVLIIAFTCALTAFALFPAIPNIAAKEKALESDSTVSLVADYDDLVSFQEGAGIAGSLEELRVIPVSVVLARTTLPVAEEKLIRDFGFTILWRLEDGEPSEQVLARIAHRDSVINAGERYMDAPRYTLRLAEVIKRLNNYLTVVEFSPLKPVDQLLSLVPDRLVRLHMLTARETFRPSEIFWTQRVTRACRERWVRMVCFRFSSGWTNDQNIEYFKTLAAAIRKHGFLLGWPTPIPTWDSAALHIPGRVWLAVFIGIMGPLAISAGIARAKKPLPIPVFTVVCLWAICVGTAIHGLLASPMASAGIDAARGVKAQLLVPLVLGAFFLLTPGEVRTLLERPIRWKDIVFGVSAVLAFVAIYLMRSGNLPAIQVTNMEREVRDALETIFGARPRFKECIIGHPLLIAGLNRLRRQRGGGYFHDGRALIAIGMIGPISIINTFAHVAAPFEMAMLRTFHGFWIGVLVSIPLSWWIERQYKKKPLQE